MPNPTLLTLGQAAKLCGRSKPTLSKALKEGRLSYVEKTQAGYQIDPAELSRVFPYSSPNSDIDQSETPKDNPTNTIENSILQAKLEASEQRFEDAAKTIDDLRARLDKSEAARERQDLVLADLRDGSSRKGFFRKLFG
jgi:hypothetical protein